MSMFNLMFGGQAATERGQVLLAVLGFTSFDGVGRYRDSWVEKGPDGEPIVAVYTRNGGGNRECWCDRDDPELHAVPCTALMATEVLPAHPLYLRDADDDFDATYATFYFRAPAEHVEALREIAQEPVNMSDQWKASLEALKQGGAR